MKINPFIFTAVLVTAILSFVASPWCSSNFFVKAEVSPIVASCSANPANSARPGESIIWTVTTSGGDGIYTYSWSGTNSLSGTTASVSKTYSTQGTKIATVRVTSGGVSKTATCSATIVSWPPIVVSCSAVPVSVYPDNPITWTAVASGGNGTYAYAWSGTDKLLGTIASVSKSYTIVGKKIATIKVTSGGLSKTATCSATVNVNMSAKIACIGAAVNTRGRALGTAMTAYTQSINSAYSTRETALQQAYAQATTLIEIKAAIKKVWSDFNLEKITAKTTWISAKKVAYSQYVTAALACKAPSGTGDGSNVSSELKGQ